MMRVCHCALEEFSRPRLLFVCAAFLLLSLSLIQSLFMLTRYREEILSGSHSREADAVRATVRSSGEVILASGLTLAITFASLVAFPMNFLASIGIGASTTILTCLLVNLTFTPAMLLTFPRFFSDFSMPSLCLCVLPRACTRDVPDHPFGAQGLDEAFMPMATSVTVAVSQTRTINAGPATAKDSSRTDNGGLGQELLYDEDGDNDDDLVAAVRNGGGNERGGAGGSKFTRMRFDSDPAASSYVPPPAISSSSVGRSNIRSTLGVVGDDGVEQDGLSSSAAARLHGVAAFSTSPRLAAQRREQSLSLWFKSAVLSTTTPISVLLILIMLGAAVPFVLACLRMRHTIDQSQLLPRNSPALEVLQEVQQSFAPGIISAYHVLVTADNSLLPSSHTNGSAPLPLPPLPLFTPEYFAFTSQLVESILQQELVANNSLTSLVYALGVWTRTASEAEALLLAPCPGDEAGCVYKYFYASVANSASPLLANCSQISLVTSFPPLTDAAQPFVKALRQTLHSFQDLSDAQYGGAFKVYLTGGATSAIDAVQRVYGLFPLIIVATVGVVLVGVGLQFRSVVVPLRLVLTLALPLAYTYGLAVMIFQEHKAYCISSEIAGTNGQQ